MSRPITEDERALIQHITMWGSDGYPINKWSSGWTWGPWRGVKGPPTVFKTKREAAASFEAFERVLIDALGEEARLRHVNPGGADRAPGVRA